jgi:hypothetical protein
MNCLAFSLPGAASADAAFWERGGIPEIGNVDSAFGKANAELTSTLRDNGQGALVLVEVFVLLWLAAPVAFRFIAQHRQSVVRGSAGRRD